MKYRLYPISKPFVEVLKTREQVFLQLLDDVTMHQQMEKMLTHYDLDVLKGHFMKFAGSRSDMTRKHNTFCYENRITKKRAQLAIHDTYIEMEDDSTSVFNDWLYFVTANWLSVDENSKIQWIGLVKGVEIR